LADNRTRKGNGAKSEGWTMRAKAKLLEPPSIIQIGDHMAIVIKRDGSQSIVFPANGVVFSQEEIQIYGELGWVLMGPGPKWIEKIGQQKLRRCSDVRCQSWQDSMHPWPRTSRRESCPVATRKRRDKELPYMLECERACQTAQEFKASSLPEVSWPSNP
jgi:hypothetical protein